MGVTCRPVEAIRLDGGVISELFHVGAPVWSVGLNLQVFVNVAVNWASHEVHDFPHWGDVDVQKC